jgi:cytochrome c-type biogenesis protein CcmH/NrfF
MLSAAFLMLMLVVHMLIVVFQSDVISSVVTPQQQQQQRYRSSLAQFRVECMTCYNLLFLSLIQIEQNKPFMVTMANANFL